jgi:Protein of unknown function (DUF2934)
MATRSKSPANTDGPENAPAPKPAVDEPQRQPRKRGDPRNDAQDAGIPEDQLKAMIEREAYLRSERRGFEPGHEEEDWLAAEAEIRRMLRNAPQQKH